MGIFGKLFGSEGKKQDLSMEHNVEHQRASSTSTMEHPGSASTSTMAKDPVCGMDVDVNTAAAKSEYQGQTYYFCSPACKTQFDKEPAKYISGQATGVHSQAHGCC